MKIKRVLKGILVLVMPLFLHGAALAESVIAATPYGGGIDIRFGNVNTENTTRVNEQVTLEINPREASQYRIYQQLQEPLTNERGESLPNDALVFNALTGRNKYGTLHTIAEQAVGTSRVLIYTSNSAGTADSFILSYAIKLTGNIAPGYYAGRIAYIIEGKDFTTAVAAKILNIYVQIETRAIITINTPAKTKYIALSTDKENLRTAEVDIELQYNVGRPFKIYQFLAAPLTNQLAQPLTYGALSYEILGGEKGTKEAPEAPVSMNRQLLYTSKRGEKDALRIIYKISDIAGVKAGIYRSAIQFYAEGLTESNSLIDTLNIELEIPEEFYLQITPGKSGGITFDDLKPGGKSKASEMIFQVKSNTNEKYQVKQVTDSGLLTNKAGQKIPAENFTLKTQALDDKELPGRLGFSAPETVRTGEMILYASDNKGTPVGFMAVYELNVPEETRPDQYSTNLTYTLEKNQ